jgi:hypothetical protein
LFANGVDGGESLVKLTGRLTIEFCVGMTFVGGSLTENEVFCRGVLHWRVGGDLVSGREGVELFYVAVMAEGVGPPAGVLRQ